MASITGVTAPIAGGRIVSSPFYPTLKPTPPPKTLRFAAPFPSNPRASIVTRVTASSSSSIRSTATGALILTAATAALLAGKFSPARAESLAPPVTEEQTEGDVETGPETDSSLSQLLESNPDTISALRSVLYRKLDEGDDAEALLILRRLVAAQPAETEWKFLAARLLNEMGEVAESRKLFEEILAADPLSFEALFENAVLMDRCGEGPAVIERLERALELARAEGREKAARDVRLIMAQIQFLQKNVDEALASYEELAKEDPKDYRPYFCQGVIYSLLDRNKEARGMFSKYHELSPRKFEVDAYLQTSLSREKLFGTEDSEI